MGTIGIAVVAVVLAWWASTAVVLRLVWLPERRRAVLWFASSITVLGLVGMLRSKDDVTSSGAYVAFGSALALWGGHELSFLLGAITGPRRERCPAGVRGLHRFRLATATVLHHELALAATCAIALLLTWGAPNQVGAACFGVLWVMRITAKLSVFLGVRNISESFVPEHLKYLATYFGRGRSDGLVGLVVLGGGALAAWLGGQAVAAPAQSFATTGYALVATLLGLAVLEHVFLVVPVPDAALWRWVVPDKSNSPSPTKLKSAASLPKLQTEVTNDV